MALRRESTSERLVTTRNMFVKKLLKTERTSSNTASQLQNGCLVTHQKKWLSRDLYGWNSCLKVLSRVVPEVCGRH